jgi:hypothetical protein
LVLRCLAETAKAKSPAVLGSTWLLFDEVEALHPVCTYIEACDLALGIADELESGGIALEQVA